MILATISVQRNVYLTRRFDKAVSSYDSDPGWCTQTGIYDIERASKLTFFFCNALVSVDIEP